MDKQTLTQIASELMKVIKMITENRNDFLFYENKLLIGKLLTESQDRKYKRLQLTNLNFSFRNQLQMKDKEILAYRTAWENELEFLEDIYTFCCDEEDFFHNTACISCRNKKKRISELTSALKILEIKDD
jgi:hypothetical protein